MAIGTPLQHPSRNAGRGRVLRRMLALAAISIVISAAESAAQQSTPARTRPQAAAPAASPFLEAETLLRQGSIEEAKQKIQEQLKLNPSSVEGYNLLGIVYSSEKDYDHALEAFQHALTLDPGFARTHNNLGNVYVAQQKFDLAEKEFGKVLRARSRQPRGQLQSRPGADGQGSPAEAIVHFQRVRPADIGTRFNLIRAYLQAGRTAEGLKAGPGTLGPE